MSYDIHMMAARVQHITQGIDGLCESVNIYEGAAGYWASTLGKRPEVRTTVIFCRRLLVSDVVLQGGHCCTQVAAQ